MKSLKHILNWFSRWMITRTMAGGGSQRSTIIDFRSFQGF